MSTRTFSSFDAYFAANRHARTRGMVLGRERGVRSLPCSFTRVDGNTVRYFPRVHWSFCEHPRQRLKRLPPVPRCPAHYPSFNRIAVPSSWNRLSGASVDKRRVEVGNRFKGAGTT